MTHDSTHLSESAQKILQDFPDEAAEFVNHGVVIGKEHAKPSPDTMRMFQTLTTNLANLKTSLDSHIQNVCTRSDSDKKRDAFIDRLIDEEMEETIAFEFLKKKAKRANGWLATFMDFSKSAATVGAILYAVWHFITANVLK